MFMSVLEILDDLRFNYEMFQSVIETFKRFENAREYSKMTKNFADGSRIFLKVLECS